MTDSQWFDFWIAMLNVVGGGLITLAAVFVGAYLALRNQRRVTLADEQRRVVADVHRALLRVSNLLEQGKHQRSDEMMATVKAAVRIAEEIPEISSETRP